MPVRTILGQSSLKLLSGLTENATCSSGEERWIVISLSKASLFQASGSLEHRLKRRSSVRNREIELFFQILDSHIIQKDVRRLKTCLLGDDHKIPAHLVTRFHNIASSQQPGNRDLFTKKRILDAYNP